MVQNTPFHGAVSQHGLPGDSTIPSCSSQTEQGSSDCSSDCTGTAELWLSPVAAGYTSRFQEFWPLAYTCKLLPQLTTNPRRLSLSLDKVNK